MQIAEIFESIQGEGPWAGTPSLFIRTSGCNLRCSFCDTPYTSWKPEGTAWSIEELTRRIASSTAPDVVLTGGEPMLLPNLPELARQSSLLGRRITIETAGTVFLEIQADLVAISPKLSNSTPYGTTWAARHETARCRPDIVRRLIDNNTSILKFVINEAADLNEVREWLRLLPELDHSIVWLMPEARTREQLREKTPWLRELARANGFNFSSRLHVEMFGNQRGT